MSLEDIARMQVARCLPGGFEMRTGKFPGSVVAAMKSNNGCLSGDEREYRESLNLRPDGYAINAELGHILCVEIEDTNPLSRERLEKYVDAWLLCDYEYWLLRLWTTDRYGRQVVEHDLCRLFYDFKSISRSERASKVADSGK